ncbi:hypothetical protein EV126DRAFT_251381 [Verticillium dahliae]|nr:hypothetical protein EV126DRAFT_251381 [Verticillium dahliae]
MLRPCRKSMILVFWTSMARIFAHLQSHPCRRPDSLASTLIHTERGCNRLACPPLRAFAETSPVRVCDETAEVMGVVTRRPSMEVNGHRRGVEAASRPAVGRYGGCSNAPLARGKGHLAHCQMMVTPSSQPF